MFEFLRHLSDWILRVERVLLGTLAAAVTGLILINVVTRAFNMAIFWIDELAIYTMIWMVMVGASVIIRRRKGIAVTLISDAARPGLKHALALFADGVTLFFAITLVALCWLWYDPGGLMAAGFDLAAFSGTTFNFIYQEPTNTLGIPKYWVWLIMPFAALTMSVHACFNFLETLLRRPSQLRNWED